MQPKFIRSLFFLLLLNLLIKPFWLLAIDRKVQNMVGMDSYGLYYALLNLTYYLQIILDPGIHTHNNRELAKDGSLLSKNVSDLMPIKFMFSLLYMVLTIGLGLVMGYQLHDLSLLYWITLNQVLASYVLYVRSNLSGLYLFNTDSIFSVMDKLLMILICGLLIWGNFTPRPFKIAWFVYAQTGATALTAIIATAVVLRKTTFFRPRFALRSYTGVLKQTYPFALLTILMSLYTRLDSNLLERLLPDGAYQAGVYASAYRLLDAFNMIAFLFATVLLPVFTGMIHNKERIDTLVKTSARLLLIPSFLFVLSCFYYQDQIVHLLYPTAKPEVAPVFGWLMMSALALCGVYIYGTLLTANGNLRFLNTTAAIGLVGNVVLNLLMIFRYGALGSVVATLLTQLLVSLGQYIKAHRVFKLNVPGVEVMKIVIFLAVAIGSFQFLHGFAVNWIYNMVTLFAINLTFAFAIGLLDFKFFFNIIKHRS
jgi:O-antigen/teichoic acid export membrane protein